MFKLGPGRCLFAILLSLPVPGGATNSPTEVLQAAYMAANKYDFAVAESHVSSEVLTKIRSEGAQSDQLLREGWLEITRNGHIKAIEIPTQDLDVRPLQIEFRIHYMNDKTVDCREVLSQEKGEWKIGCVPALAYVANVGIWAAGVTGEIEAALVENRQGQTRSDMLSLMTALESYAVDHPGYPVVVSGKIDEITPFIRPKYVVNVPLTDGWGNPLKYYCATAHGPYWIISYGADGKPEPGVYDPRGIPVLGAASKTTDPDQDIIAGFEGSFLREPGESKASPGTVALAAPARPGLSPEEVVKAAYLAAAEYEFAAANGYLGSNDSLTIPAQGGSWDAYLMKKAWQAITKNGTIDRLQLSTTERSGELQKLTFQVTFRDGLTEERVEFLQEMDGEWKLVFPSTFHKEFAQISVR